MRRIIVLVVAMSGCAHSRASSNIGQVCEPGSVATSQMGTGDGVFDPAEPIPVAIILARDYAAFRPATAGDRRIPLRAIVMLGTLPNSLKRTVILNPEHADENVLFEALSIVRQRPRFPIRGGLVPLPVGASGAVPSARCALRMRHLLTALQAPDARESTWPRTDGKVVDIADLREMFRDAD